MHSRGSTGASIDRRDGNVLTDGSRRRACPAARARRRVLCGTLVVWAVSTSAVGAQGFPASQRAMVAQTIAFTEIVVRYGRPVARGRRLFGDSALVPWGAIWHPGADSATRISLSHDVVIEGHVVKAGDYSFWLLPRENAPWTVVLSRAAHVFHTPYPGAPLDALRFDVTPERGAHMESLAIYFPSVIKDDAVLRIHWGEAVIPLRIKAPFRPASGVGARRG